MLCRLPVAVSQDMHFSQFFATPMFTNPANAGNFEGDFRVTLNNKNQWNAFTNAYRTFIGSFDASFTKLLLDRDQCGAGIQLNNDIAGDGKFGTYQIYATGAYYLPIGKMKKLHVGAGVNIGYVFHNINFNNLSFGNQYVGDHFDINSNHGETWQYDRIQYFDIGVGMNIKYRYSSRYALETGLSVSHLTTPQKSFSNSPTSILPIKWMATIVGECNLKDDLWLEPLCLAMFQDKYMEIDVGGLVRLNHNPIGIQAFYAGLLLRTKDAGIFIIGAKYQNFRFLLNYDINLSKLSSISRGKGGIEFSIQYIFLKPHATETPVYRKCPDFI